MDTTIFRKIIFQGRFVGRSETPLEPQQNDDVSIHDRRTPISHNQYYGIHSTVSCKRIFSFSKKSNLFFPRIHPANDDEEDHSPIKSASYMDELRQRLERVLNDSPQQSSISSPPIPIKEPIHRPTLIPPPKLKLTNSFHLNSTENLHQIKPPITIGSTPLPRKQIQSFANLSYRTMNTPHRHSQQQQMSKSFIIPSKHEGILVISNHI